MHARLSHDCAVPPSLQMLSHALLLQARASHHANPPASPGALPLASQPGRHALHHLAPGGHTVALPRPVALAAAGAAALAVLRNRCGGGASTWADPVSLLIPLPACQLLLTSSSSAPASPTPLPQARAKCSHTMSELVTHTSAPPPSRTLLPAPAVHTHTHAPRYLTQLSWFFMTGTAAQLVAIAIVVYDMLLYRGESRAGSLLRGVLLGLTLRAHSCVFARVQRASASGVARHNPHLHQW